MKRVTTAASLLVACTGQVTEPEAPAAHPEAQAIERQVVHDPVDPSPALRAADERVAAATQGALHHLPPCGVEAPAGMACIPAGPFVRGVDEDEHACHQSGQPHSRVSASTPSTTIEMPAYFLDITEVTVEAFETCVDAGGCREGAGPRYLDFDRPTQPIVGISWFDAQEFCQWRGAHLPTEAEWEKGARGPNGDRTPFGNDAVTCESAVIRNGEGRSCGVRKEEGSSPETGRVLEVGSRPAGHYGLVDMVGNAEEWVADWWTEDWNSCGEACVGPAPNGLCNASEDCDQSRRVVRGGSWYWPAEHATGYHRRRHYPSNSPYHHFGFRCAATPAEASATSNVP